MPKIHVGKQRDTIASFKADLLLDCEGLDMPADVLHIHECHPRQQAMSLFLVCIRKGVLVLVQPRFKNISGQLGHLSRGEPAGARHGIRVIRLEYFVHGRSKDQRLSGRDDDIFYIPELKLFRARVQHAYGACRKISTRKFIFHSLTTFFISAFFLSS